MSIPATWPLGCPYRGRRDPRSLANLDGAPPLVEREPDERGQHVERIGEHRGRGFHLGGVAGIVRRPAPTDGLEVGVVREHGHVDRFGHRDV
jgi:hypothetical protein